MIVVPSDKEWLKRPVKIKVTETILTAHIISPLRGKGSSSSNSSVLYLRASGMMHRGLRFKYHHFSRLVVSSAEFGEVAVKVSSLPPPLVAVVLYPTFARLLSWQSRVSSHNLVSRVRAIVCSENDLLFAHATYNMIITVTDVKIKTFALKRFKTNF